MFCIYNKIASYDFYNKDTFNPLQDKDYEVFINPQVNSTTEIQHFEYEYCPSFPMFAYLYYKYIIIG